MAKSRISADSVALRALEWIVGDDDMLGIFLGSSGASESDLRTRADDPEFLAAVVDFLMMDDAWIVAFCNDSGVGYEQIAMARAALPGGAQVNWT